MEVVRRFLDFVLSLIGLVTFSPLFFICAIGIRFDSAGPILYRQARVGRGGRSFLILKFRSMVREAEEVDLWVTGEADPRITRFGRWMRRFKLDELPQFFNVLRGEMSLVGPRPRLRRYARMYPESIRQEILSVRPGITDPATLFAFRQEELLGRVAPGDREEYYIKQILPGELQMNLAAIRNRTLRSYFGILFATAGAIVANPFSRRRRQPEKTKQPTGSEP